MILNRFFGSLAISRSLSRLPAPALLPILKQMIDELRLTNSSNEKEEIVRRFPETHPFLKSLFTSGPLFLTSKTLEKTIEPATGTIPDYEFIEDLIGDLSSRRLSGHEAIRCVKSLISRHNGYNQLILNIIDKDLRIRMASKSILGAIGDHSDPLSIALAHDYKQEKVAEYFQSSLAKGETWFASRKLDGVRCIALGRDLNRLESIKSELEAALKDTEINSELVLDGEICCFKGDSGYMQCKEDFRKAAGIVNSNGSNKGELTFILFDMIPVAEFQKSIGKQRFSERQESLRKLKETEHVKILPQTDIKTMNDFKEQLEVAKRLGWEGIMLRRDTGYEGKRTRDLIKCKEFQDSEFLITGYQTGPFRTLSDGLETVENLVSSISINFKGSRVDVGSGFSLEERREMLRLGDGLIGRRVTVCYFEETKNKIDGKPSLRFPTFKSFRD